MGNGVRLMRICVCTRRDEQRRQHIRHLNPWYDRSLLHGRSIDGQRLLRRHRRWWYQQKMINGIIMDSSAEKDKAMPDSVCKRYDTIGFEEEDTREEHQAADAHFEQTLTFSLGEAN